MAIPMAAGAARLIWKMTKGALRQTKRLSPYKSTLDKGVKSRFRKKKGTAFTGIKERSAKTIKTKQELTAIGKGINRSLKTFGASAKTRSSALSSYNLGYKHVNKHKKLYGAGLGGAVAWDILDND